MKYFLFLIISLTTFNLKASEEELVKLISDQYNVSSEKLELVKEKIKMHHAQKERMTDLNLPPKGAINLTPFMQSLVIFSPSQLTLLDMFKPYCESEKSPYGGFCMGSDIELTNWMLIHRNYYNVLKSVILRWNELLDSKNEVNLLTDFSDIQMRYKLTNIQFFPLLAFLGLDDNGIQYDRFLEALLKINETDKYVKYFGLLFDYATIHRDLPDYAIGKISYSLRIGTGKILSNKVNHKKTYKDFSLFGIACLAINKKIPKDSISLTTKLMTTGYELLKLRNWSSKDWENPGKKIDDHISDAQKRLEVSEEIIAKAEICNR